MPLLAFLPWNQLIIEFNLPLKIQLPQKTSRYVLYKTSFQTDVLYSLLNILQLHYSIYLCNYSNQLCSLCHRMHTTIKLGRCRTCSYQTSYFRPMLIMYRRLRWATLEQSQLFNLISFKATSSMELIHESAIWH